jgi:hypothetical protein
MLDTTEIRLVLALSWPSAPCIYVKQHNEIHFMPTGHFKLGSSGKMVEEWGGSGVGAFGVEYFLRCWGKAKKRIEEETWDGRSRAGFRCDFGGAGP